MGREDGKHVRQKKAARKRKHAAKMDESEENEEINTPETDCKKIKINFDPTDFISQLKKDGVLLSEVLGSFCACAKSFTCGVGDIDAVQEYLQHSPQCAEITELLTTDKRPNGELQLIFNCLTSIILRLADDLHHFRSLFLPSLHVLLRMHMRHVYRALNPKNMAKVIMAALRFLTAVVALDTSSAHEVLNVFKFDHGSLTPLYNRRNSKAEEDVRTCLMRFAVAFLVSGDQHTTTQFLANKDFLKGFFKGLVEDRASTLQLFLNALLEHLVRNPDVTKTQKLPVLNEFTLFQIAHLYGRWKGVHDIQDEQVEAAEDLEQAGREAVRRKVHSFLIEVTTSTKHGINFLDKSIGLGGKNLNSALLKFLQMLKTATTDDLVADLVVHILKTCPDLLSKYLSSCPFSFTPRASSSWLANVDFIKKIFDGQSSVSPAFTRSDKVGVSRLVSMVMVTTVPAVANHAFLLQCIKHPSPLVCLTGLQLIDKVMQKAKSNMEQSRTAGALLSHTEKHIFVKQYQESLLKVLPDVDTLLSCWERYLIRIKEGSKHNAENIVSDQTQTSQSNQEISSGLAQPEPAEILVHIMRILAAYTIALPSAFLQTAFDFSRLLHGIFHSDHMTAKEGSATSTQHALQLQYETMKLLMGFDVGRFRWFKEVKGEGSAMGQLLTVLMTSSDSKLIHVSKQLICQVLKHTGQFDQCPDEPVIWLDAFSAPTSMTHDPKVVTGFLQRILSKVVRNPYPHNDRIMEAVTEMEMKEEEDGKMEDAEEDSRSVSEAGLAAILDMDEIPIIASHQDDDVMQTDQSQGEEVIMTPDLGQSGSLPCSALVPAALEEFSAMEENGKVADYLSRVLTSILNTQHDPRVICHLVYQSSQNQIKPVTSSWNRLLSYCNEWLPKSRQIKVSKLKAKQSSSLSLKTLSSLLQESFMNRAKLEKDVNIKQNIMDSVPSIGQDAVLPIIQQCLLYVGSCTNHESSNDAAQFYTDIFIAVLHQAKAKSKDICNKLKEQCEPILENTDAMDIQIGSEDSNCKEDCDWLKLSTVILRHPIICGLSYDPCTERVRDLLAMLKEFVPQIELERELRVLVAAAEDMLRTLLVPSENEAHSRVITDLLVGLKGYIDPGRCLCVLREVVSFMKQEIAKGRSYDFESRGLLCLTGEYLLIASRISSSESNYRSLDHSKVASSRGSSAAVNEVSHQHPSGSDCLDTIDVKDILGIAVEGKSWALFRAVGQLLKEHTYLLPLESDMKGALSVCLEASRQQRKQMGDEIIPILIKSNPCQFEDWIMDSSKKKTRKDSIASLYPSVAAYLSSARDDKRGLRCRKYLQKLCWTPLVNDILKGLGNQDNDDDDATTSTNRIPDAASSEVLCLLLPYAPQGELRALFDAVVDLPSSQNNSLNKSQLEVLKGIIEILLKQDIERQDVLQQKALRSILLSLVNEFKSSEKNQDQFHELSIPIKYMLEHLKDFESNRDLAVTWKQFVISGLKTQYHNPAFLDLLTQLVELVYCASHSGRKFMPLSKLYHAVVGHSKFLPTMLGPGQESTDVPIEVKGALVKLLLAVSQREPSCCNTVHFTILLGAYTARRTVCDRGLLSLMHIYEKNNAHMWEYRPYIWGKEAVTQHAARKALGRTLWKQPSVEDVLKLLDAKVLYDSMLKFPLDQTLHPNVTGESSVGDIDIQSEMYDPSFLLPLFSHLLQPENLVPCQTFVESNALGFVIASLSSRHDDVRQAGYHILSCFVQHLEGARFRGRREIAFILGIFRNSVSSSTQYIPPLLTVFLSRSIHQMLQPESALYPILISYLMFKPQLNLAKVPLFPRLFVGAEMQHKSEKTWFLSFLTDGLRSPTDFKLCTKSNVFQTLLAFYASPLCEKAIGDLILGVLVKACEIPEGAVQLFKQNKILIWIQAQKDSSAVEGVDRVLHALEKSFVSLDSESNEIKEALHQITLLKTSLK
nr:nucleolar pre-ribosomal-associated protein 1-like [Lytechinus pictus]